jgi:hypothetical protein
METREILIDPAKIYYSVVFVDGFGLTAVP